VPQVGYLQGSKQSNLQSEIHIGKYFPRRSFDAAVIMFLARQFGHEGEGWTREQETAVDRNHDS